MKLVVLLGNQGLEYARTRHNFAWLFAESLPYSGSLVWLRKFNGIYASHGGALYLKPETYMNRSGESVGPCVQFYKIRTGEILVVHDDIELPFGEVALKQGGGLGGHNGLRDIERVLSTRAFARLRLGISRPSRGDIASYVLSRFSPEEESALPAVFQRAFVELERFLAG